MKNKKEKSYKPKEPKTIAYDYMFNYFGKDLFKGKVITGACVSLAIRVYRDGKEIRFTEEPRCEETKDTFFNEIFNISFDREKLFSVSRNIMIDNLFRISFGWDKIEWEVVGYSLDYLDEMPEKIRKKLPKQFQNMPCSSPIEVTEKEFRDFLRQHLDDFDISDNVKAQVPSISYI